VSDTNFKKWQQQKDDKIKKRLNDVLFHGFVLDLSSTKLDSLLQFNPRLSFIFNLGLISLKAYAVLILALLVS
jgi:hypothetical protein